MEVSISVTFSVDTLDDMPLLLQIFLTDRDERPLTPEYLSFKKLFAFS